MSKTYHIDPYKIDRYVDGEMSPVEANNFEKEMASNSRLKSQVCNLQNQKLAIQQAYAEINTEQNFAPPKLLVKWQAIAASILIGAILGISLMLVKPVISMAPDSSQKYVVHLDTNQPEKLHSTIEKTHFLLAKNPDAKVQIIANHEGIELFNANNASNEEVIKLLSQHQNIEMLACRRTVERAKKQGKPVSLLPAVRTDEPAVDEVVKRLKQGWTYIKI